MKTRVLFPLALLALLIGCSGEQAENPSLVATATQDAGEQAPEEFITAQDIRNAAGNNAEWLSYGRTYAEDRYSPLSTINRNTVGELGVAWSFELDTNRGQEATPLVIDGVIYFTSAWSKAFAVDARTGEELWRYDPQVPGRYGVNACCDVVNRGMAAWADKVYFGTLDGRLIALDRETGDDDTTLKLYPRRLEMQKLSIGKIGLAAAFMLILAACSSNPGMRIGNTVTLCCPGNYAAYNTYAIEDVGLPIFLREYVAEEFDKAFQELGMTRNDARSDLVVNLNYRHVNLNPDQQQIDPFIRMESMNVELDYIANIDITMRERAGGKEVWAGTISRIHSVQPGEYMHEGNARGAFLVTFRDLLSEYPRNQE